MFALRRLATPLLLPFVVHSLHFSSLRRNWGSQHGKKPQTKHLSSKSTTTPPKYGRFLSTVQASDTSSSDREEDPFNMSPRVNEATQREFKGKTVLLTGASGGLGRSLALQLAACEVGTLVLSARKQTDLDSVAQECRSLCPTIRTHVILCDLADPASVDSLAASALKICSKIDVLVNNGGVSSRSRFIDTAVHVDRQVMQINFLSGAALAKAVVPTILQKKTSSAETKTIGRIIWISSVQGLVGIPNRTSYAASKFAVQGYCESLRAELHSSGVFVHVVSPGYIRTNLSKSALTGDGTKHGVMDETTAQGAHPDDVATHVLDKVAAGCPDIVVAAGMSAKVAVWLRLLCPGLLQSMLVKRYEKSVPKDKEA